MKTTILKGDASQIFPSELMHRIHYRNTLQRMSDKEVDGLLHYLNRFQIFPGSEREFRPGTAILTPKEGGGERDCYQFGVGSKQNFLNLQEEIVMRQAEQPRRSLRQSLSRVLGGYV